MKQSIDGVLLLDKPIGVSSNNILQKVKWLFKAKKAGHTGTLDPLASGMLPICFGQATKFSQYLLNANKTYQVTCQLGEQTDTGDREGEIIAIQVVPDLNKEKLENILTQFLGEISQIPPMYSALKHQGQPLYKLARKGVEIERPARKVQVLDIKLINLNKTNFELQITCSKGTYIRTLIEDIAKALGTVGHVIALRRLSTGGFESDKLVTLDMIEALSGGEHIQNLLLPIDCLLTNFPKLNLLNYQMLPAFQGRKIILTDNQKKQMNNQTGLIQLIDPERGFIGLGELLEEGNIKPKKMVAFNQTTPDTISAVS